MLGYMGKMLRVDLTQGSIREEPLNQAVVEKFVGGYGLGGKILYDEVPVKADALGPENRLIYCTGPLTGVLFPSTGRCTVVAKSPLTGYFGDSSFGGFFGPMLKHAGYDLIVFSGAARKPSFLVIDEGKAELKDASNVWGLDTYETCDAVKKTLGSRDYEISCIGPAGERLVRFAGIVSDRGKHTAGRTGLGAVMGSKKLKAVAVHGSMKIPVADNVALKRLYREVCSAMLDNWGVQMTQKHGTAYFFQLLMELGDTPIRNWTRADFPSTKKITGETITNTLLKKRYSCYLCPEACFRHVEIKEGQFAMSGAGPEYQTVAALGSLCENDNLDSLVKANDLCNRYGLDTISTGVCIAFAMECYEKGILKKEDIGYDLSFGNSTAILQLVTDVAYRRGLGSTLAEGVKRASEILDKGSQDFAMHVRGLEVPMHDPRAFYGIGIGYAVGPTGARHTEFLLFENQNPATRYDIKTRAKATIDETNVIVGVNALGICFKPLLGPKNQLIQIARAYSAVTGIRTTIEDLKLIGNRIFNLKRTFTLRHGSTIKEDTLPQRLLTVRGRENGAKERILPLKEMLDDYYKLRGWDSKTGKPKRETLEKLGLTDIANDLWS